MIYEWDPKKATANLAKHKVSFDDPDHSLDENRVVTIGTSSKQRIRFLAHADRGEDHVRIIHARPATTTEAHAYQESRK